MNEKNISDNVKKSGAEWTEKKSLSWRSFFQDKRCGGEETPPSIFIFCYVVLNG